MRNSYVKRCVAFLSLSACASLYLHAFVLSSLHALLHPYYYYPPACRWYDAHAASAWADPGQRPSAQEVYKVAKSGIRPKNENSRRYYRDFYSNARKVRVVCWSGKDGEEARQEARGEEVKRARVRRGGTGRQGRAGEGNAAAHAATHWVRRAGWRTRSDDN